VNLWAADAFPFLGQVFCEFCLDGYSENYAFETLCSVLRKHKVLSEFADELIEKIYLWPEYYEFIADVIIDKLFPVLKTIPQIKTNAILVECK
jgi:hypothetical protein